MIFVTVGTHEQPFNRLIQKIDEMVKNKIIQEEVFVQIGYSTYEPKNYKWSKLLSPEEMDYYMKEADTVICHGGPATFMKALSLGKKTIVVPRQKKYDEHVNDHQLVFAERVKDKGYSIIPIKNIEDLEDALSKTDSNEIGFSSNNDKFIQEFEKRIQDLM
ncbi:PssE/Cps14G family polysaccharide biosynthesis glycosyltransferase [Companilactobacillus furfuricola]|uniref:PssE/Cps14G family polysaccharide biosynthesis glycosyltransferase n=1 Tax=Companilactobacillus furfuricola TaxID=1462575 RepID=UPI000F7A1B42|nr:PssE/Cps14G family polysaccharide biosynthesis glycosyltransferase [Companilactobacillus furfuricola]